ncbi:MAG: hypothetical protein RLZZ67_524 [Candidatus Parcubacteria bacterium]|jgi:hypothetical protein
MFRFQSINHSYTKIKGIHRVIDKKEVYWALSIVFSGVGAYFIGLMIGMDMVRPPVTLERFRLEAPGPAADSDASTTTQTAPLAPEPTTKTASKTLQKQVKAYVASKTGTKYHLPTCIGAKGIKEANRVWFATKAEAEKAGYSPAGNCNGL